MASSGATVGELRRRVASRRMWRREELGRGREEQSALGQNY